MCVFSCLPRTGLETLECSGPGRGTCMCGVCECNTDSNVSETYTHTYTPTYTHTHITHTYTHTHTHTSHTHRIKFTCRVENTRVQCTCYINHFHFIPHKKRVKRDSMALPVSATTRCVHEGSGMRSAPVAIVVNARAMVANVRESQ